MLCALGFLLGCSQVLKAGYPIRQVQIRIPEHDPSGISIQVGKGGNRFTPDEQGVVEIELPEIPGRCDTCLVYPAIPLQRHPVPDLYVMKGDRVIRRVGLARLHDEAASATMPMVRPHA